jgi:hypothetical protein
MKLARVIHGELPFTLNLTDGDYCIPLDGAEYLLSIRNGCVAAARLPLSTGQAALGVEADLRSTRVNNFTRSRRERDRTNRTRRCTAFSIRCFRWAHRIAHWSTTETNGRRLTCHRGVE